ncbi:MAG: type II toxin-antitoxin system VapB family antitoxin [Myxococcaceae bacterium]
MHAEANLFWNGRSQAVRLPKEMRFKGRKVLIERVGDMVILRPFEKEWTQEFWDCLGKADGEFERPVFTEQERENVFP